MKRVVKNKGIRYLAKAIIAGIAFILIFVLLQIFLKPKYLGESTTMVDGLKQINTDNLDVLFLGSSQMFCAVNARALTERYDINSYDYGASNQCMAMTKYYLDEALKQCKPKIVMVELGNVFYSNAEVDDTALSWNYSPTDMTIDKYHSLMDITNDSGLSAKYTFCPLLLYHSRWAEIYSGDIKYFFNYSKPETYVNRGFLERNEVVPMEMKYFTSSSKDQLTIPEENKESIMQIAQTCQDQGIQVVFFKIPVPFWTKSYSLSVKSFMDENHFEYIDYFDRFEEFGLDKNTDYRDDHHANIYGAEKITSVIGEDLNQRLAIK